MHKNSENPNNNGKNGKNGKTRFDGPLVYEWVDQWWDKEASRVAEIDSLGKASKPTLLTRIAKANLDLTSVGLERYSTCDRLHRQKTKSKNP